MKICNNKIYLNGFTIIINYIVHLKFKINMILEIILKTIIKILIILFIIKFLIKIIVVINIHKIFLLNYGYKITKNIIFQHIIFLKFYAMIVSNIWQMRLNIKLLINKNIKDVILLIL